MFFPHRITLSDEERERFAARGIRVIDGEVSRVVGEGGHVSGVELADGRVEPRAVVFVGPRFQPRDELAAFRRNTTYNRNRPGSAC